MKNLDFAALLTVLLAVTPSFGSFSAADNGTTAADFLNLGIGARALAMGEAYTSMADGADALFWNPAGLVKSKSFQMLLNHQPFLESLNYNVGALAVPLGGSTLALGYAGLSYDEIDSFDLSGNKTGSFEADDQEIAIGYGRDFRSVQLGGAVKFIRSSIARKSAAAYAVDLGLGIRDPFSGKLSHDVTIQNLGSKMTFDTQTESLPILFKLGSKLSLTDQWDVALDLDSPKDSEIYGALGSKFRLALNENTRMALRAGYETRTQDVGDISGLGLGGGLTFSKFIIDFAWIPQGDMGSSRVFTLKYEFGESTVREPWEPTY